MSVLRLILCAIIFVAAWVSMLSTLFYSEKAWLLGVAAFLIVWSIGFFGRRKMPEDTHVHKLKMWLTGILGAGIFISLVTLFSTARSGGVCVTDGKPIFAKREHYLLTNHGAKTEVSRARYLAVGTSFIVGWHFMILIAATQLLLRPKCDKN